MAAQSHLFAEIVHGGQLFPSKAQHVKRCLADGVKEHVVCRSRGPLLGGHGRQHRTSTIHAQAAWRVHAVPGLGARSHPARHGGFESLGRWKGEESNPLKYQHIAFNLIG